MDVLQAPSEGGVCLNLSEGRRLHIPSAISLSLFSPFFIFPPLDNPSFILGDVKGRL